MEKVRNHGLVKRAAQSCGLIRLAELPLAKRRESPSTHSLRPEMDGMRKFAEKRDENRSQAAPKRAGVARLGEDVERLRPAPLDFDRIRIDWARA